jgi:hypothetical protein
MILIDILILVWVCYKLPELINNIKKCDPYYDYNIIVINKITIFIGIILILLSIKSIIQSLNQFIQWL